MAIQQLIILIVDVVHIVCQRQVTPIIHLEFIPTFIIAGIGIVLEFQAYILFASQIIERLQKYIVVVATSAPFCGH